MALLLLNEYSRFLTNLVEIAKHFQRNRVLFFYLVTIREIMTKYRARYLSTL
ncbi:hypothetical protein GFK82_00750 [Candidatus Steffania adelgidicola]|nr:hypothetical protein GFK82_00750 [Candidatus Steffania adelgidicola]